MRDLLYLLWFHVNDFRYNIVNHITHNPKVFWGSLGVALLIIWLFT